MKNTLFLIIPLLILGVFVSLDVKAGVEDNISGYAWSENIGWISFNCTNLGTCGVVDYGVNIEEDTGAFSGYAWSENIGWIDFAPSGPYPSSPESPVGVNLENGEISGWARALSYGDGWDGWIKMRGDNYGVSINMDNGEFEGWAWSNTQVTGWISFNCELQENCEISDYKVKVDSEFLKQFNRAPNTPGVPAEYPTGESWSHCSIEELSLPTFHWTYSDPDDDPQTAYEIRIDNDSDFSVQDPEEFIRSGGASTAFTPLPADWRNWMDWNTDYWWIVRVKDDHENWSEWSDPNSFAMPVHAYPWVNFSWSPPIPNVGEIIQFTDQTLFYGGATGSSWSWDFGDGDTETAQNPTHSYASAGTHIVTLEACDDTPVANGGPFCCGSPEAPNSQKNITPLLPLPEWEEISPF